VAVSVHRVESATTTFLVTWSPNPVAQAVSKYTVVWGPESNGGLDYPAFAYPSWAGQTSAEVAQKFATVPTGAPGSKYYFAVVASRSDGTESGFSAEAVYTFGP
jgi:hypothetical protein